MVKFFFRFADKRTNSQKKDRRLSNGQVLILSLTLLALLIVSPALAAAGSWPMFLGGPAHKSASNESVSVPLELKWRFKTGGAINSSPVIDGSKVLIGSYDGYLYALDASSGKELWRFKTGGEILSTPAISGGAAYFGSKDGNVYAVSLSDGSLKWKFETEREVLTSPVVADGSVFIGSSDLFFYSINAADGKRNWRRKLADSEKYSGIYSSPAYNNGNVYISGKNGLIYSYDAESGGRNWFLNTKSAIYSSPTLSGSMLFVSSYEKILYAVDMENGTRLWRKRLQDWPYSSISVDGTTGYMGLKNGDLLEIGLFKRGRAKVLNTFPDAINATPVRTEDGLIFVGSEDSYIYAFDPSGGEVVWSYKTGGGIHSSPAVADSSLFVGSKDGYLYAFGS